MKIYFRFFDICFLFKGGDPIMRITEVLVAKSSRKTRFKHFNFFSNFQQKNGITFDMQTPNKKNT